MENKVKLVFEDRGFKEITYNGAKIQIVPFLSMSQQITLINNYLDDYFGINPERFIKSTGYNLIEADMKLKNYLFQACTNIDATDVDDKIYADEDFYEELTGSIENYWAFRQRLVEIVSDVKEQVRM